MSGGKHGRFCNEYYIMPSEINRTYFFFIDEMIKIR